MALEIHEVMFGYEIRDTRTGEVLAHATTKQEAARILGEMRRAEKERERGLLDELFSW